MAIDIIVENRKILEKRAAALARVEVARDDRLRLEVTSFHLGKECYAVETSLTKEVIPLDGLTPLPCVPPFIAGIMNVRGRILSLIDVKRLLGLPGECADDSKVIILSSGTMEFGLIVDAIDGVTSIPTEEIQESMPTIDEKRNAYFRGITANRMIILDGGYILNDPDLVIHENVL